MKQKNKKLVQFLVIIAFLIILSLAYFNFINQKDKRSENTVTVKNSNEKSASPAESTENKYTNTENIENEQIKNETPPPINTAPVLAKNEIMDYINNNIEILAPSAPVSGVWKVNRFWFTNDKNVYVEYSSNGELKQILVTVEGDSNNPIYNRKSSFNSGESSWVLEQGQDTEFGKNRELYEKTGDKWVKKN